MDEDQESRRKLVVTKLLHGAFLASMATYIHVLLRLPSLNIALLAGNPLLNVATSVFAILGAGDLWFWYYWPRLLLKAHTRNPKKTVKARDSLFVHLIRICFLESIAIYSLFLGVLGASYEITLPFLAVATVMLAITFPTKRRWSQMQQDLEQKNGLREPESSAPMGLPIGAPPLLKVAGGDSAPHLGWRRIASLRSQ